MINAWSLLYEELNGTMDKTYPIENNELNNENINITTGTGNTAIYNVPDSPLDDITFPSGSTDEDSISIAGGDVIDFTSPDYSVDTLDLDFSKCYSQDDVITFDTPTPGIEKDCTRKYKEDESIEALKNYISTTYGGHYTSDNNNVQTLDLIESVGDAESFCRSNAIKYLSRYDKKGQAKRDILKALHYSLLLYHFSGQLNETPTRGYETF
mgnify:CR=1 FL=1